MPAAAAIEAAERALRENHTWYQTIELAPGVVTPGQVDLRATAAKLLPDDLTGKRCLDVGTFDGFWAFEMERRGAEVVAIDLESLEGADWPPLRRAQLQEEARELDLELGRGFRLASDLLGSRVVRVPCNVYDLSVEAIGGPVDFAFSGAILLHLRDPVRALERVRDALVPGGELRLMEEISLGLTILRPRRPAASFKAAGSSFNWWVPNVVCLMDWVRAAGLVDVRRTCFARPPAAKPMRLVYAGIAANRAH